LVGEGKAFDWLMEWGFDGRLASHKSRTFSLVFHSENDRLGLTVRDALCSDVARAVNNMIVESMGVKKTSGGV
jgi:hypothetical protein